MIHDVSIPAALIVLAVVFLPTRELADRFASTADTDLLTSETRVAIWRDTIHEIEAYKWTGSGLGAYERGLYKYKTAAPTNTVDFAHNDYLQIVAELGFVGAALVAALLVAVLWNVLRVVLWSRGQPNWELAVGLLGALLTIGLLANVFTAVFVSKAIFDYELSGGRQLRELSI